MNIINFENLDSTNLWSKSNIEKIPDKSVVLTNIQTSGYGRFKRPWLNFGEGNLFVSFVLKPSEEKKEHASLTQYTAICISKVFDELGIKHTIKWPNDVLINGKKVCGILTEATYFGGKIEGLVIGIGMNLVGTKEQLKFVKSPATSLALEGFNVERDDILEKIYNEFFKNYDSILNLGFSFIKYDYKRKSHYKFGDKITFSKDLGKKENGIFRGFDDSGALIFENKNSEIEILNCGEIV